MIGDGETFKWRPMAIAGSMSVFVTRRVFVLPGMWQGAHLLLKIGRICFLKLRPDAEYEASVLFLISQTPPLLPRGE